MAYDPTKESKLIEAALTIVTQRNAQTHAQPQPHDDAAAEYAEECLIHAAREYVEHTKDRELVWGG